MDNFKGAAYMPNYFEDGIKREVIAVCKVREKSHVATASLI
jgi:hypothetical protein